MKNMISICKILTICIAIFLLSTSCISTNSQINVGTPISVQKNPDKKMEIELEMIKATIFDVTPIFAEWLNFNYMINRDASHYKTVTIQLKGEYTKKELWAKFNKIMEVAEAKYILSDNQLRIYPKDAVITE